MNTTQASGGMSRITGIVIHALLAMVAVTIGATIVKGNLAVVGEAILQATVELPLLTVLLLAAGGYGGIILLATKLIAKSAKMPLTENSPSALLIAATACAVGFWFLAMLMLILGTFFNGALNSWLWWIIVAVGSAVAIALTLPFIQNYLNSLPSAKLRPTSLIWTLIFAAAIGVWIGGATCPTGFVGSREGDFYDVLEYHMQVPREYYIAGQITQLHHNVYSHYPLGMEMLFLVAMCLRGGAYEAMYLCNMIPGLFLMVGAAGLFGGLGGRKLAGRTAAALLSTAPAAAYLAWQPMVELGSICYLAVAMAWLAIWMRTFQLRTAIIIGMMLGAACATKYLAVGFILAPTILVMIIAAIRKPARLVGVVAAAIIAAVLFCPWLVRNYCYTKNPVFPLATNIFGKGYWTDECNQRWIDGHGPENKPPVPIPQAWVEKTHPSRIELFWQNFIASEFYGISVIIVIVIGSGAIAVNRFLLKQKLSPFSLAMIFTLLCQTAIWIFATHGMPWRFIATAIVPISILLAMVHQSATDAAASANKTSARNVQWLKHLTLLVIVATIASNFYHCQAIFSIQCDPCSPLSADEIIAQCPTYKTAAELKDGKILLVGDAKAFYYPPGTVYATTFDPHPLEKIATKLQTTSTQQNLTSKTNDALINDGIKYILLDPSEITRLMTTYGFSPVVLDVMKYQPRENFKQAADPCKNIPAIYELN